MTHCINSRQMMRRAAPSVVRIGSAGCLTRPHHRHSPGKRVLGAAFPRCARGWTGLRRLCQGRARETRLEAPEAAEIAVVRLEHIEKRYDGGAPVIANVSLTLAAGGFYFLTGASGSGKTTLLRLITLAARPTDGRLTLFGADTAALDRDARAALRRRIGIVFQGLWLIDALSAGDNVALPLRIAGAPEHEVRASARPLNPTQANARTATLSGGERQRVAIA